MTAVYFSKGFHFFAKNSKTLVMMKMKKYVDNQSTVGEEEVL